MGTSSNFAKNKYDDKNYKRICIKIIKSDTGAIEKRAKDLGFNVSKYIKTLIEKDIGISLYKEGKNEN